MQAISRIYFLAMVELFGNADPAAHRPEEPPALRHCGTIFAGRCRHRWVHKDRNCIAMKKLILAITLCMFSLPVLAKSGEPTGHTVADSKDRMLQELDRRIVELQHREQCIR